MPVAPTYPVIGVGDLVTADLLTSMLPGTSPVKQSATSRTSTTTLTADPDLSGITLGVGTYEIELFLFFSFNATVTQKIVTQWGFSGTWNNPVRGCLGPGADNVSGASISTSVSASSYAANASSTYNTVNAAQFAHAREISATVSVSAAGDLSLLWAQSASVANATIVQPGSYFRIRQIG